MVISEQEQLHIHVRWMIRRDMNEVLGIEQAAFEYPWSDDDFTRCLRQRNCIGMVGEVADSVVAFMIYELHRKAEPRTPQPDCAGGARAKFASTDFFPIPRLPRDLSA